MTMKDTLKSIGGFAAGLLLCCASITLIALFLFGAAWLSEKVLPVLNKIGAVTFLILLVVFVPLSFSRKFRPWCAPIFVYWSYFGGLLLWMLSLLVTLNFWGIMAVVIGLLFAGVGVFPVALLACIFNGAWGVFFGLLVNFAMVMSCRIYGLYLADKAERECFDQFSLSEV